LIRYDAPVSFEDVPGDGDESLTSLGDEPAGDVLPSSPSRAIHNASRPGKLAPTLPLGTTISPHWDEAWIDEVEKREAEKGMAICGARPSAKAERTWPCSYPAGYQTDHLGEGRCHRHGGAAPAKTGQWSLLRHRQMRSRVQEFIDSEDIMDIRNAVAVTWATVDTLLEDDSVMDSNTAKQVVDAMRSLSTMIKQYNDITAGQKIVIEVPQFMEWAEAFYELAIKYIIASNGDVRAFLAEAQHYYDNAVTIVTGRNSTPAIESGDPVETEELL
jgi:hypothetical protein